MEITRLNANFAASPQIQPEDVAAIVRAGYRSIISNRPEAEEAHQPSTQSIEAAAVSAGLGFAHIPVKPGGLSDQLAQDMARAQDAAWPGTGVLPIGRAFDQVGRNGRDRSGKR